MYNSSNGGDFRTHESLFGMFMNSCLGKLVVLAVVCLLLTLVAFFTCPTEKTMRAEMTDNIYQCLQEGDSHVDKLDNTLANIAHIFTKHDSMPDKETLDVLKKYNRFEYYNHGTFATAYVFNNFHVEGTRCGIGIFGMVIPMLSIHDLVLQLNTLRRDYDYHPMQIDFNIEGEENHHSDYLDDNAMLGEPKLED